LLLVKPALEGEVVYLRFRVACGRDVSSPFRYSDDIRLWCSARRLSEKPAFMLLNVEIKLKERNGSFLLEVTSHFNFLMPVGLEGFLRDNGNNNYSRGLTGRTRFRQINGRCHCRLTHGGAVHLTKKASSAVVPMRAPLRQTVRRKAEMEADGRPSLVESVKDGPLGTAINGLFDKIKQTADNNVFPHRVGGTWCDAKNADVAPSGGSRG